MLGLGYSYQFYALDSGQPLRLPVRNNLITRAMQNGDGDIYLGEIFVNREVVIH